MNIQTKCPKCGVFNETIEKKCWKCNRPISEGEKEEAKKRIEAEKERSRIEKEHIEAEKERIEAEKAKEDRLNNLDQEEKTALIIQKAKKSGDWGIVPSDVIEKESKKIILTTSYILATHDISSEIEIITAEIVYGMNIFRDLFAGVRDIVGGRSGAVQKVLKDSRQAVLSELRKEALMVGADAVIAIDLDYQELSGGGKNGMIMLVASGTAVKIERSELV